MADKRLTGHVELGRSDTLRTQAKAAGVSVGDLQNKLDLLMAAHVDKIELWIADQYVAAGKAAGLPVRLEAEELGEVGGES